MPESYIEPLTDRRECFTCHKTVTGKRKLSKCAKCHAITYCGKECQVADWPRHNWNCVPVMVTEIPGKGRGLVAARDIKMGELIFKDKPVIKLSRVVEETVWDAMRNMDLLLKQFDKLPSEAKLQFHKLKVREDEDRNREGDILAMQKFKDNCMVSSDKKWAMLFLNTILLNHSCAPNAAERALKPLDNFNVEIRAIKDISRGEEITKC